MERPTDHGTFTLHCTAFRELTPNHTTAMVSICYSLHIFPGSPASRPLCFRTIVAGLAGGLFIPATMIKSINDVTPITDNAKRHALFKNLSGIRFGRLIAQKPIAQKRYACIWLCLCDCGKTVEVLGARLNSGRTTSCSCYKTEIQSELHVTHGQSKSRTYRIWSGIRNRCTNPNVLSYPYYGGRGIKLCERWRSFDNFLADMGEAPEACSIDRINNDGNYEPGNCRWTTQLVQAKNCRKNVHLTAF